jgi:hypothetical protein
MQSIYEEKKKMAWEMAWKTKSKNRLKDPALIRWTSALPDWDFMHMWITNCVAR